MKPRPLPPRTTRHWFTALLAWATRRRLPPAAIEDYLDGADLGDHAVRLPPRRRLTLEDLDRLDADFRAGGPVADAVVRGLVRDFGEG